MEMIALDTLGKLHQHGHGLFGWCSDCGSPSRYWSDVGVRRTPKPASFDIDLRHSLESAARITPSSALSPSHARGVDRGEPRRA
jgi:hypothetical protein